MQQFQTQYLTVFLNNYVLVKTSKVKENAGKSKPIHKRHGFVFRFKKSRACLLLLTLSPDLIKHTSLQIMTRLLLMFVM